MTTHGLKLSLIELTKKYNASFRSVASPVDDIELLHGIQQLSNFKVCSFQLAKPLLHVGTALGKHLVSVVVQTLPCSRDVQYMPQAFLRRQNSCWILGPIPGLYSDGD